jgi:hypothetical protein
MFSPANGSSDRPEGVRAAVPAVVRAAPIDNRCTNESAGTNSPAPPAGKLPILRHTTVNSLSPQLAQQNFQWCGSSVFEALQSLLADASHRA